MRDEIEQWKGTVKFWQNRHDNFLKQIETISADMERLKSENNALIFVNRELGAINDNLSMQIERCKSSHPQSTIEDDDNVSEGGTPPRPRKKSKPTPKSRNKISKNTSHETADDEGARVCKIHFFCNALNEFFSNYNFFS